MPTYLYLCEKHGEFEEFHSITIKLEYCPQCKNDGKNEPVERLISLNSKGIVELYGNELTDKIKADARQLKKDAAKDEKVYSNLLGEEKYQTLQVKLDDQKRIRRK